ncbi:hypothetical protein CBR_g28571 [Chara braunii]|uniref:RRM domain-containing protein n=1 Tax=Chara braunii TaxID=69332 RepID=A0A388JWC8_CHABU|nr:hypothetical protein CBR_g28571 [Chara braunii]|eukprot:GBG62095.1 hypothetical protein CBR_g28571 [Chara braunii]
MPVVAEMVHPDDDDGRGSEEQYSPRPRMRSPLHNLGGDGGPRSPQEMARDDRENGDRRRQRMPREDERERERARMKERDRHSVDRRHRDDRDRDRDRERMDRRPREDVRERERDRDRDRDRRMREYDRGDRDRRSRHRSRSRSRGRSSNRSRSHSRSRSRSRSRDRKKKCAGSSTGYSSNRHRQPHIFPYLSANLTPKACNHKKGEDWLICVAAAAAAAAAAATGTTSSLQSLGQLGTTGMTPTMPGIFTGAFPFAGTQFGGLPAIPAQAMTQQATRHARRVYVGGLPPMTNEQSVATFFSSAMAAVGGNTAGPGDAVVNVYINQEKKFAFVEFRTVEEASNAMALDGINYEGVSVRVRRPSDYNPSMAATLGPSQPSPHLNLANVGLTPGTLLISAAGGADGPDRIFIGGLPYYLTETQIKELLSTFGPLRAFDLVRDRDTGNSKGYGFCVYQDPAVVDVVCAALNGMKMGDKTLTVRRATASGQPKPDQANVLQQAQQQIALQQRLALGATGANAVGLGMNSVMPGMPSMSSMMSGMSGMSGLIPGMMASMSSMVASMNPVAVNNHAAQPTSAAEVPTRVVCLVQVVTPEELKDDEEYEDIMEDMREECGKYGTLTDLVIPRPSSTGEETAGLGKVFVEYSDSAAAAKAKASLHGRKFGGNTVIATYYPEDKFSRGEYGG